MSGLRTLASICLAAAGVLGIADIAGWRTLSPKSDGFTIQMPGTPESQTKMINDAGVIYPATKFRLVRGNFTYQVAVAKMGPVVRPDQVPQLFANIIGSMAKVEQDQILSNQKLTYQGYPAEAYLLKDPRDWATTVLLCWDGKRSYIVSLKGPNSQLKLSAVKEYMNTFRLLPSR